MLRAPPARVNRFSRSRKILRFIDAERRVHWSIAIPFLVCYTTAVVLVLFYNSNPLAPHREIFSWTHRISGIFLAILPLLALVRSWRDYKIHLYNIKQAWIWNFDDLKWICLMGLAAISRRFSLPEQGKFNAPEKLNFMLVMVFLPLLIDTGILIWLPGIELKAWFVHVGIAIIYTPFLLGHIFMATINPDTRKGLEGMVSGFVDRHWAEHHYRRWYRENFEQDRRFGSVHRSSVRPFKRTPPPPVGDTIEDFHPVEAARRRVGHHPNPLISRPDQQDA